MARKTRLELGVGKRIDLQPGPRTIEVFPVLNDGGGFLFVFERPSRRGKGTVLTRLRLSDAATLAVAALALTMTSRSELALAAGPNMPEVKP